MTIIIVYKTKIIEFIFIDYRCRVKLYFAENDCINNLNMFDNNYKIYIFMETHVKHLYFPSNIQRISPIVINILNYISDIKHSGTQRFNTYMYASPYYLLFFPKFKRSSPHLYLYPLDL